MKKLVISVLAIAILACGQSGAVTNGSPTEESATGVIKGYGISPLGFPSDYSHFPDFLKEIGQLPNGGVMHNGPWREDIAGGSDAGEIPNTAIAIVKEAPNLGYTPIVVFGWRSDDGGLHISVPSNATDDWSNTDAQDLFGQMLGDFAEQYHPPYLFLGNESDAYFTSNPEDYARWVAFYNRAYDVIKAASPETMVGPIFQYERMSGQGNFNQWTTPQWGALETHDLSKVDMVGITVYPWIGVASPQEIPDDYFAPLLEKIGDKPVAITETGWPGENLGVETAWLQTAQAQVDYVAALDRILDGVKVIILNWLHYYQMAPDDSNASFWKTYSSISMIDYQGNKRPVYDTWVNFQP